ncbi:hypothetical protein BJX64DRAFT_96121 [Aspergillus heterothallicus]
MAFSDEVDANSSCRDAIMEVTRNVREFGRRAMKLEFSKCKSNLFEDSMQKTRSPSIIKNEVEPIPSQEACAIYRSEHACASQGFERSTSTWCHKSEPNGTRSALGEKLLLEGFSRRSTELGLCLEYRRPGCKVMNPMHRATSPLYTSFVYGAIGLGSEDKSVI